MTDPNPACPHSERFRGVFGAKNGCACCAYEERIRELEAREVKWKRLVELEHEIVNCDEFIGDLAIAIIEEINDIRNKLGVPLP